MASEHLHPALKKLNEERDALDKRRKAALRMVQSVCEHPFIVARPFHKTELGSVYRERRLCACCGLEEEAWNFPGTRITDEWENSPTYAPKDQPNQPTILNREPNLVVPFDEKKYGWDFFSYRP